MLNTPESPNNPLAEMGHHHIATATDTPLRPDAFALDDDAKMELIAKHFREIMQILGLDLTDDSLRGTPRRVAKMYVKEVFRGLNPKNQPKITLFENRYHYGEVVAVRDITFYSMCEHHFIPFFGKAHVAYIPKAKVAGLSKINRLVRFYAQRPQIQERLTVQIAKAISECFATEDVAVAIEATHLCVAARGVEDDTSNTMTTSFLGKFCEQEQSKRFLRSLKK